MYALQALQMDGTWYTLSHHTTQSAATYAMLERGSYKNRTVKYRVEQARQDAEDDSTGFGTCDCCGERLPLSLVRTPLGHETWECAECTAQWDGDAELDTMTSDGSE